MTGTELLVNTIKENKNETQSIAGNLHDVTVVIAEESMAGVFAQHLERNATVVISLTTSRRCPEVKTCG